MEKIRIRDPGWKKFGSGIRDQQLGSVTLVKSWIWIRITVMWNVDPQPWLESVLRIRDVYPGSEFFHPGSASKNLYFNPKNGSKL